MWSVRQFSQHGTLAAPKTTEAATSVIHRGRRRQRRSSRATRRAGAQRWAGCPAPRVGHESSFWGQLLPRARPQFHSPRRFGGRFRSFSFAHSFSCLQLQNNPQTSEAGLGVPCFELHTTHQEYALLNQEMRTGGLQAGLSPQPHSCRGRVRRGRAFCQLLFNNRKAIIAKRVCHLWGRSIVNLEAQ